MPWCDEFVTYGQNFDFKIRRDNQKEKKNHMSVATMSRQTKRAYLRLCPEKQRKKKNPGSKGINYKQCLSSSKRKSYRDVLKKKERQINVRSDAKL